MRTLIAERDDAQDQLDDCRPAGACGPHRSRRLAPPPAADGRQAEAAQARGHDADQTRPLPGQGAGGARSGWQGRQPDIANAEVLKDRQGAVDQSVRSGSTGPSAALAGPTRPSRPPRPGRRARARARRRGVGSRRRGDHAPTSRRRRSSAGRGGSGQRRGRPAQVEAQQELESVSAAPPPSSEQGQSATGAMRAVAAGAGGGASAAALIELAQRLHDEHVGQGQAKPRRADLRRASASTTSWSPRRSRATTS